MNRYKTDFLCKLREYFSDLPFDIQNKSICVCLSGGADSVCLLRALIELSHVYGFLLSACHFNHMIRGEESYRDELFCKKLCKEFDIKLYCGRDDVPANAKFTGKSLEEAARDCRYSFFSRILNKNNIDYCATAHNMNDDAETLLINLVRGSGSNGASAIAPYNNKILRPMLKISRKEIENYLSIIGQEYVTDSTNSSVEYTRNFVRHIIIDELKKINPSVEDALSRYIESCRCDRDYFEKEIETRINDDLRTLHKAIRHRIILRNYKAFSGNILNSEQLIEIDEALFNEFRTVISVNAETEAVISNGNVMFFNKAFDDNVRYDFSEVRDGLNSLFDDKVIFEISDKNSNENIFINKIVITNLLSFDNIIGQLKIRNRREGDRILIKGVNKNVKKLFIDKKVPKEYRNIIPVVCDDEGIIYIPFVGISDRAFPKGSSNIKYVKTVFNTIDIERWSNAYEK